MFGINTKRLKQLQAQIQTDGVDEEVETSFSDVVENYKLFARLVTLIETIMNASDLGLKNLKNVVEVLTEDMDDEEYEDFVDLVIKLLFYLKVSQSAIDDLLDEDEEISAMELENLIELVIERMGENDLYEFVAYAIHNPELPDDVDTDSIQMDWAFYPSKNACKNKKRSAEHICVEGYRYGKNGFWSYHKAFKGKEGGISATNYMKKVHGKKPTNIHSGKLPNYSEWLNSMRERKGKNFGKKKEEKQNNSKTAGGRHGNHKSASNIHKAG